jgi:hypothetical protein
MNILANFNQFKFTETDSKNTKIANDTQNKNNNGKQPIKKNDDEIDLFGDDETVVEPVRKLAPKKDDKPKKKEKVEKTFVMLDIKP